MLNETGFCNLWINQDISNSTWFYISDSTWFNVNGTQRLLDKYLHNWSSAVDTDDKCYINRLFVLKLN